MTDSFLSLFLTYVTEFVITTLINYRPTRLRGPADFNDIFEAGMIFRFNRNTIWYRIFLKYPPIVTRGGQPSHSGAENFKLLRISRIILAKFWRFFGFNYD